MNLFTDIWGAVYIPAQAYNPWQMWNEYDPKVMERDMGYAAGVSLNAIRMWLSYERWREDPKGTEASFESALKICHGKKIRVLISLFENCGVPFTPKAAADKNPFSAMDIISPPPDTIEDPTLWEGPRKYVRWFMDAYRNDERLLAVEIMNEPWNREPNQRFALDMLQTAQRRRGAVPLTMGTGTEDVGGNLVFALAGIDILQVHFNFPKSLDEFEKVLKDAKFVEGLIGRPVWLTEWQRLRVHSSGWKDEALHPDEWAPGLATLAPLVRRYRIGSFFWSLMVKPAYLSIQRKNGTLNGLFHEDGAVWSLDDARAISGDPAFHAVERKEWPSWCAEIPASLRVRKKP